MLDDVLAPDLALVVCGTAAGKRSGELKQYYAGPGNKFWRTLWQVGLTPQLLSPGEADQLLGCGIGLTDVVKGQSGPDSAIRFDGDGVEFLRGKLLKLRPRLLCFNGKRSAQVFLGAKTVDYGLLAEQVGSTMLFVAPSTSAAANGSWDLRHWQELAALVQAEVAEREE